MEEKKVISKMNKQSMTIVDIQAMTALKKVAEQYGLTVDIDKATYTPLTYSVTFKFGCVAENGVPAEFIENARRYGYTADDYGLEFIWGGRSFKLEGFNPRRRKYPVTAKCQMDGGMYKLPLAAVANAEGIII